MSMAGIRVQPYRLSELLSGIAEGKVVLPEFQRDFDWSDEEVASLIATIIMRWPAGSLLLMDGREGDLFFRVREFEGAPSRQAIIDRIVLDGQQRLTGLYQAVYDTGEYVYAVSARVLTADATVDELEAGITSFSRSLWDAQHRAGSWSPDRDWIPFYALRSPAEYFAWRDATVRGSGLREAKSDRLAIELADAYRHGLEAFHQYDFPAVILERDVPATAVARIFERVNTTGIPLTTFDLMVAKTFMESWNLRDLWDAALAESAHFAQFFGDDGMAALQVIALKNAQGVRQSEVLSLAPNTVHQDWAAAVAALDVALDLIVEECGALNPAWLPYGGLLLTLAGAVLERGDLSDQRQLVRAWFFARTFGQDYEVGANTVTVSELRALLQTLETDEPLSIRRMSAELVVAATRRRRSSVWRGFMCSLAANGAVDLDGGAEGGDLQPVNVLSREHHPPRGEEPSHLLTLGFVLASRRVGRQVANLGADGFRDYLANAPKEHRSRVLETQLLPPLDHWGDSDRDFVRARAERLSQFLKATTGSPLSADPPAEGD